MSLVPERDAPVYVAGHRGLAGSAIWRELHRRGFENLIGWSSDELDLRDGPATMAAIQSLRPAVVIMAAARVGGIQANSDDPVHFLNDNLRIQTNVFSAAHAADVDRLLFLGSSCIYPKLAPQPIPESALLTGPLESTNRAYAVAKIAGIVAIQSYRAQYGRRWISVMPTNLYGPGDNFDLRTAHVLPALIRRFDEASESGIDHVTVWGSGTPRREFMHTADLARAMVFLMRNYDGDSHVNVGTGSDVTIRDLTAIMSAVTGFGGEIRWDTARPDGTPRKLLDVSRINSMGWRSEVSLPQGIADTYEWYLANKASLRA